MEEGRLLPPFMLALDGVGQIAGEVVAENVGRSHESTGSIEGDVVVLWLPMMACCGCSNGALGVRDGEISDISSSWSSSSSEGASSKSSCTGRVGFGVGKLEPFCETTESGADCLERFAALSSATQCSR